MIMHNHEPKILLIEDDPDQIAMYKAKFELEGFNFIAVRTGSEGIKSANTYRPDLILLDLILVGENGMDILKELKKDAGIKAIPVLVLTNLVKNEAMEQARNLGSAGYIIKADLTPSELVEKVKRLLYKR